MSTKIEWAEESWNPITGCTPVSEGCEHCYARRQARRFRGRFGYPEDDPFRVTFHGNQLYKPLHWHKPRIIFVCSMGDLFHRNITYKHQFDIYQIMDHCKWHTFLILTKRPDNMQRFFKKSGWLRDKLPDNLWLGVSIESNKYLWRIDELLKIPAAKHFVSIEPMLGPVEIPHEWLTGEYEPPSIHDPRWQYEGPSIDWVIVGGESGSGARPMHPNWPRSIRDQCQAAGVPFFFKQHGEYVWEGDCFIEDYEKYPTHYFGDDERGGIFCIKTGKKAAGRLLDGREWNEVPPQ